MEALHRLAESTSPYVDVRVDELTPLAEAIAESLPADLADVGLRQFVDVLAYPPSTTITVRPSWIAQGLAFVGETPEPPADQNIEPPADGPTLANDAKPITPAVQVTPEPVVEPVVEVTPEPVVEVTSEPVVEPVADLVEVETPEGDVGYIDPEELRVVSPEPAVEPAPAPAATPKRKGL